MSFSAILGDFADDFHDQYWQKKPLLIRQAFPGGLNALDADELAGLATQEGVDARLVLEHGERPWEMRQGPFTEDDFQALPPTHWTLLVQAVDRLLPSVSALRQQFRFLPLWRIDDIMISYAPDQGSVGPHTDNYDVFLVQGQGRRRWEFTDLPLSVIELEPGLDMKILKHFQADQSFILEPGDMLYLPPRVAHHGVALGSSLTYSIGFRAPTQRDLVLSYAQFLLRETEDEEEVFYRDAHLESEREPGRIEENELNRLWEMMQRAWQRPELFKRWVGGFLTEPRSFHEEPDVILEKDEWQAALDAQGICRRVEGAHFAYHCGDDQVFLYTEGECSLVSAALEPLVAYLCREEIYDRDGLKQGGELGHELLRHLWNRGFLRAAGED